MKTSGKCLTTAQCSNISGYYSSQISRMCQKCATTCFNCINESHICSSCRSGYYLHVYKCLAECPTGYYKDGLSNMCVSCSQGDIHQKCVKCLSQGVCQQCNNTYFLYTVGANQSVCLSTCPAGYYGYVAKCIKCKYPCL